MSGWIRGAWKAGKEAFKKQKTTGKEVITSFKPAKNLTKRREDFEDIVKVVDKHGKTAKSSKIKRDAAIKVSNIHTKYEKLKKILEKKK